MHNLYHDEDLFHEFNRFNFKDKLTNDKKCELEAFLQTLAVDLLRQAGETDLILEANEITLKLFNV